MTGRLKLTDPFFKIVACGATSLRSKRNFAGNVNGTLRSGGKFLLIEKGRFITIFFPF